MQKSFSFKGITRNSDNLLVAEGECMELINLRVKDGCLVPFPSEYDETELQSCYSKVYWHSAAEMFLCIEYGDEGNVHIYNKDYTILLNESDGGLCLFPLLTKVERIEFMGNIVCCIAARTTYYLIFATGKYKWLGERPTLPELSFSYTSVVYEASTDDEYMAGISLRKEDDALRWGNVSKGYFDQCLSMLHSHGYYVDRALFRYALRLFDGSYFCYSPIYYVDDDNEVNELARDSKNFQSGPLTQGSLSSKYVARVQGFLPTFHLTNLHLEDWENVIVGIDVFTSGSIYGHKVVNSNVDFSMRNNVQYSSDSGFERYVEKDGQEIVDDVQNVSVFYKVAEFNNFGVLIDSLKDVSPSSLALCDALPDDIGSLVNRSAAYSYTFNGRLHLGGIREVLMKGYNPRVYLPAGVTPTRVNYALVVTRLKTHSGISVVKREYIRDFTLGLKDDALWMTPYIMYPDARAYEITFTITMGDTTYRKTFPLKQHKTLNLAQYVNPGGSLYRVSLEPHLANGTSPSSYSEANILAYFSYTPGVYEVRYVSDGIWYYGDKPFVLRDGPDGMKYYVMIMTFNPRQGDTITITVTKENSVDVVKGIEDIELDGTWELLEEPIDVQEENECEIRGNVLKVSSVDNPFYFPAKNTYAPSSEDIVAVCSNTVALSQGQFGRHPLYLFCKNGVWAMESDASGSLVYATSYPVSREVCTNAASVCGTDSGVAFVTARGLMLLQGTTLAYLSETIDADTHFMQQIELKDIFHRIATLVENQYSLSRDSFSEYIANAEVALAYIPQENELWISCVDYNYTYVYSLNSGVWTKIPKSFICFVNHYPHQLYVRIIDDKSSIATIDEKRACPYSAVTLFTRPQLFGTKLPKRIMQFMLHAVIKSASQSPAYLFNGLGCYLLCSNDGVHFKLVMGSEKKSDFNDIVFPYFPTSAYKYYVIALSGTIANDSRIVGAELNIATVWENRLR